MISDVHDGLVLCSDADVDLDVLGDLHDLGEFDDKPRSLLEVGTGKDLHSRGTDQHFGLVDFSALCLQRLWMMQKIMAYEKSYFITVNSGCSNTACRGRVLQFYV